MDYDGSYHGLFSNPEMVEDLLINFVYEPFISHFNFATLTRANVKLQSEIFERRQSDIIYYIETFDGDPVYLYLFLEFQSSTDRWMSVRIATYVNLFYEQLIQEKKLTPKGLLPPVFALVLYNGDSSWKEPSHMTALIDLPPKHPLREYQPAMRYYLIDETKFPAGKQGSLSGLLFKLESAKSKAEVNEGVTELVELLKHHAPAPLKRAFTAWIKLVLAPSLQLELKFEQIEDITEGGSTMLKNRVIEWEREYQAQKQAAAEEGMKEGLKEGLEKGLLKGLEQGLEKGIEQGRCEGRRVTLKKQLQLKFQALPEWAEQRIDSASEALLEAWSCRLITSNDLDEILG